MDAELTELAHDQKIQDQTSKIQLRPTKINQPKISDKKNQNRQEIGTKNNSKFNWIETNNQ